MSTVQRNNTQFKQTELGKIPEEWEIRKLAELVQQNRPISYGIVQTGNPVEGGIPCVRVVDLVKSKVLVEDLITTTPEISSSYSRTVLQEKDIMFALRGEIGHVVMADQFLIGANLTRGVALIAANEEVKPEFLLWAIRSPMVRSEILLRVNGSALREITIGGLRQVKVPIPPLPEQKKIAAILSSVDEAIASTQAVIDQTRKVKQGLLQQLLTRGIGHTKFKDSAIGEIPEVWEVVKTGDVCTSIVPGRNKPKVFDGDIPWITIPDIEGVTVSNSKTGLAVSREELKRAKGKTVPRNTVVMTCVGNFGIAAVTVQELVINQQLHGFVCSKSIIPMYLCLVLRSKVSEMESLAGQTTVAYLNSSKCESIRIPLPPVHEQEKIVEKFLSLENTFTANQKNLAELIQVKQGLMQDLLTGKVRVEYTP